MRFAALVGLCALAGVSVVQLVWFAITTAVRGLFLAAMGPAWPFWLPAAAQLFALVVLAQRRRRASAVAAGVLLVPLVVSTVFFASQAEPVRSYYWLQCLAGAVPAVFLAALLVFLVRDPSQWHPDHSQAAPGRRWWAYLLCVAVPAGVLQVGVTLGTLWLFPGALSPYSAVLLWVAPCAAVGLFLATVGRGTPRATSRVGAALVLLSHLPSIGLLTVGNATVLFTYSGGHGPTSLVVVAATCGPLALYVAFLLFTGMRATRADDLTKVCEK